MHTTTAGDNTMTVYAAPGAAGAKITYKPRYDNFIGGKFVPPVKGQYFDVITPVSGKVYTQAARSTAEDIELALDAAHAAADSWGKTDAATRANILLKIANRIEENLERLAYAETVDNGKAIRETLNADIPLTVDHFRYFAGCVRARRRIEQHRREHCGVPHPGTAGRGGPDHPVELPHPDGGVEAGTRAGCGQLRGA